MTTPEIARTSRTDICRNETGHGSPEQAELELFRATPLAAATAAPFAKTEASGGRDLEYLRRNPPVLMNEREVAVVLNVCPRSIRNFTARRILPVIRLGRRRLFRRDAVWAALQALESGGAGAARWNVAAPRRQS